LSFLILHFSFCILHFALVSDRVRLTETSNFSSAHSIAENLMSGPIVRTGTTPEFWKNYDRVFGGAKTATTKKAAPAKAAKKTAAPKKAVKKAAKKK